MQPSRAANAAKDVDHYDDQGKISMPITASLKRPTSVDLDVALVIPAILSTTLKKNACH